jgi:hypothetical protein
MTHIAGIPFPWKKTEVISKQCPLLKKTDTIEIGDLLCIPGHVMIMSGNNEIIEARGYSSGYGCIHRAPLNRIFENIYTYEDLLRAYHRKIPLVLLDKKGVMSKMYATFTLHKLVS